MALAACSAEILPLKLSGAMMIVFSCTILVYPRRWVVISLPGARMYYFAYGSNMCTARLAQRVPGVKALGSAWLGGHRLYWHLRGGDGSGKCNIVLTDDPVDRVHGVLFEFDEANIAGLHAA